jgi:hypothetical protein
MIKELLHGDHLEEVGKEQGLDWVTGLGSVMGTVVDLVMVDLVMVHLVRGDLVREDLVMDLNQVKELDRGTMDLVMGLDLERDYLQDQDQGHHHRQEWGR